MRTSERVFPSWPGQMFASRLRTLPARLGHGGARRLGPRSVSRGAVRAILESVGGVHSNAARRAVAFVGMSTVSRRGGKTGTISGILIEAPDDAGAEREGPQGGPIP